MTDQHRLAKLYGVKGLPFPLPSRFFNEIDYFYHRAITIEPGIDREELEFILNKALGLRFNARIH